MSVEEAWPLQMQSCELSWTLVGAVGSWRQACLGVVMLGRAEWLQATGMLQGQASKGLQRQLMAAGFSNLNPHDMNAVFSGVQASS